MWRLLPFCLLVGCVATDPGKPTSSRSSGGAHPHVVRVLELPLQAPQIAVEGEPRRWTFQDFNISGWLDEYGHWNIHSEVSHGRFRCAIYETGIQLGKGQPACRNVDWLTPVDFVTRDRHCNSATRIHTGGGTFPDTAAVTANCARVVIRCEGC